MTLATQEQILFRKYITHRLHLEIERLIPEYIHTHRHLDHDVQDKGYEEVEEAYYHEINNLTFNWSKQ